MFGGDTLTATDVAVAAGRAEIGDPSLVARPGPVARRGGAAPHRRRTSPTRSSACAPRPTRCRWSRSAAARSCCPTIARRVRRGAPARPLRGGERDRRGDRAGRRRGGPRLRGRARPAPGRGTRRGEAGGGRPGDRRGRRARRRCGSSTSTRCRSPTCPATPPGSASRRSATCSWRRSVAELYITEADLDDLAVGAADPRHRRGRRPAHRPAARRSRGPRARPGPGVPARRGAGRRRRRHGRDDGRAHRDGGEAALGRAGRRPRSAPSPATSARVHPRGVRRGGRGELARARGRRGPARAAAGRRRRHGPRVPRAADGDPHPVRRRRHPDGDRRREGQPAASSTRSTTTGRSGSPARPRSTWAARR